jgi:hypothetical protein
VNPPTILASFLSVFLNHSRYDYDLCGQRINLPINGCSPHSALSTVTVDNFEQVEVTDGSQMGEMDGSWTQRKLA